MNGIDLLESLGYIEDELIEQAEKKILKGKGVNIKILISLASCFAVILSLLFLLPNTTVDFNNNYTLNFNTSANKSANRLYIKGHFFEELTPEQANSILPFNNTKGIINYSHIDGVTNIFNIIATTKINDEHTAEITIAPNEISKCYSIEGETLLSYIEGIPVVAGVFTKTNDNKIIYYADFKIDDIAYYVEFSGYWEDETFFTNIIYNIISKGKADLSIFNPTVPVLRDEALSENEAYSQPELGMFLPKVPKNYQFNEAKRFVNQNSNYLLASWSNGLKDIRFVASYITEEAKSRIISINDTSLYDMSLYPIPWAESIPRDVYHIIENPIFKIEELTLNAIKLREYIINEANESSKVNTNFSVLYGNIVLEIKSQGVSSEYLYKELKALPHN